MSKATSHRTGGRRARPLRLTTAACIALALGATAPAAHAEIVSKLPGPNGLPFPGQLIDATPDGRYVLLKHAELPGTPPATGPEAELDGYAPYILRDRVADTTTQLRFRAEPGAPQFYAQPTQISDDGDRILIEGDAPELRPFKSSTNGYAGAVYDRSEERLLKLPAIPGTPYAAADGVQLSADGTRALIRTFTPFGEAPAPELWRGSLDGTATAVTDLKELFAVDASDDLNTIVYGRTTTPADRPVPEPFLTNTVRGRVVGLIQGSAAPRILAETTYREQRSAASTGACSNQTDVAVEQSGVQDPRIAPNGSRVGWTASSVPFGSTTWDAKWVVRSASGETSSPLVRATVIAFGNANETRFNFPTEGWTFRHEAFAKGETELIASGEPAAWSGTSTANTRYTEATPFSGAPVPPLAPMTLTNEPVDTANRPTTATFYSCPAAAADAPIGAFEDYVKLYVGSNLAAAYQMGSVTMVVKPSDAVREAAKVTVELTAFGLPIWRKSVTTSTSFNLPKPLAYLPQTLKVSVQPRTAPGQAAPAPIVRTRSIYTTKLK